jgi:hypothetical protein
VTIISKEPGQDNNVQHKAIDLFSI